MTGSQRNLKENLSRVITNLCRDHIINFHYMIVCVRTLGKVPLLDYTRRQGGPKVAVLFFEPKMFFLRAQMELWTRLLQVSAQNFENVIMHCPAVAGISIFHFILFLKCFNYFGENTLKKRFFLFFMIFSRFF